MNFKSCSHETLRLRLLILVSGMRLNSPTSIYRSKNFFTLTSARHEGRGKIYNPRTSESWVRACMCCHIHCFAHDLSYTDFRLLRNYRFSINIPWCCLVNGRTTVYCNILHITAYTLLCQLINDVHSGLIEVLIFYLKCSKTHLRASVISKFFRGLYPRTPVTGGGDPLPHPPPARPSASHGGAFAPPAPLTHTPTSSATPPTSKS